jgi:transposase
MFQVDYLSFPQSNDITDGFHNKMEMILHRAYGIRNFNNCRMCVLALCGCNAVTNLI